MSRQKGAATLMNMALRTAIAHHREVVDFADMPYTLARPILLSIDDPEQLREIEENSPGYRAHTAELWTGLLDRDIPGWRTRFQTNISAETLAGMPGHKLYRKIARLRKRDEEAAEAALRAQFQALDASKKLNETQIIRHAPLPVPVEYAGGRKLQRAGFIPGRSLTYKGPGVASSGPRNGSGMAAIRRKAAARTAAQQPLRKRSEAEVLRDAKRQIAHAPSSMVVDLLPTAASRAEFLQKRPMQTAMTGTVARAGTAAPRIVVEARGRPEVRMAAQAGRVIEMERRRRREAEEDGGNAAAAAAAAGVVGVGPSSSTTVSNSVGGANSRTQSRITTSTTPGAAAPTAAKKRAASSIFAPPLKRRR